MGGLQIGIGKGGAMIKELPKVKSASAEWITEAIRGLLEMSIKEPVTELTYSAIVGGELRTFGYQASHEEIIECPECKNDEFTITKIQGFLDLDCSKCGANVGAIDPKI